MLESFIVTCNILNILQTDHTKLKEINYVNCLSNKFSSEIQAINPNLNNAIYAK